MKIYTRRGDCGETDLFGGGRVPKDDLRVCAYGEVDELNACIGVVAAATDDKDLRAFAEKIQSSLFDLGSQLATPRPKTGSDQKHKVPGVDQAGVEELEREIDRLEEELAPLTSFILPGGSKAAAALHHARTVCRRAERATVALDRAETLNPTTVQYLNRLSDLLFTMARVANARAGLADIPWVGRER